MAEFGLENIQLAFFLREPPPKDALGFWLQIFASSPDGFQRTPVGTQANGTFDGTPVALIVQTAPPRVDLHVQGIVPEGGRPPAYVPDPERAFSLGCNLVEKILDDLAVGRVATVFQGNLLAESRADAVDALVAFVRGLTVPSGTEEATYRVVVPRQAEYNPERKIKQIGTWQVAEIQYVQVTVGPVAAPQAAQSVFRSSAVNAVVDVYGDGMEVLNTEQVLAELREVGALAERAYLGGPNEFA